MEVDSLAVKCIAPDTNILEMGPEFDGYNPATGYGCFNTYVMIDSSIKHKLD